MITQQLSIFLENKCGKLSEILALLSNEHIRIIAATVADTSEFGILRMIVSDAQKARDILKNNNVNVSLSEVFVIVTASTAESFATNLDLFTKAGLSIEYMYCFSMKDNTFLIIRVNNRDAALDVIRRNNLDVISEKELMLC
jgi:hypothetical protein